MAVNEVLSVQQSIPQRVEKKYDKNGELESISIFKDVNGDGKEDLYKVTTFGKMYDGSIHQRTVVDRDGDGYNDTLHDVTTKDGKKVSEREIECEDINKIKNRDHFEYEIYNRKMTTHQSGIYMM